MLMRGANLFCIIFLLSVHNKNTTISLVGLRSRHAAATPFIHSVGLSFVHIGLIDKNATQNTVKD